MSKISPYKRMSFAMLVAAGATTVGVLGAAAPATAAPDAFVAISVGLVNDAPPVAMVGGLAVAPGGDDAAHASLTNCVNRGGQHCVVQVIVQNSCAAAFADPTGDLQVATDISLRRAEDNARHKLANLQTAYLVYSGCSNGQGGAIPPLPPQPAPPKLGPTASFDTVIGGLEAHITDRSGVASQCTLVLDDVSRSFALGANATFDQRIVPLLPKFQDRNVTITCDNGTKTQATTRF